MHRHVQEGAQPKSREEGEPQQHREASGAVLAVVGSHEKAKGQSQAEQGQKDAPATEDVGEHVDVGAGRRGEHAHGEGRVHILQVSTNARLELVVEGLEEVIQSWLNSGSHFILFYSSSAI